MFTKQPNIHAHGLSRSHGLPAGTILEVDKVWQNFFGSHYRCQLPEEMKDKGYSLPWYDIPIENAEIYKS